MGFDVFTVMYVKITVFSNVMLCGLVYGFNVNAFLIASIPPSVLRNTMFIDSYMYIHKCSICSSMTIM
jgi:hypothetical protein